MLHVRYIKVSRLCFADFAKEIVLERTKRHLGFPQNTRGKIQFMQMDEGQLFSRERCFCGKEKGKFTIKSLRGDVMRFKSAQKHVPVCQGFWQVKTGEKLEVLDRILTYHEEASIRWQVWNFYFLPGYEACKKVLSKAETKLHSTSCLRARLRESSSFGQTRARAERRRKSLSNFPRGERKRKVRIRERRGRGGGCLECLMQCGALCKSCAGGPEQYKINLLARQRRFPRRIVAHLQNGAAFATLIFAQCA